MSLPSASKHEIALACPASLALPRVKEVAGDAAELGTDLHDVVEFVGREVSGGGEIEAAQAKAVEHLAADSLALDRAKALDLTGLPFVPGALYEAGFVFNTRSGAVRFVGEGLKHGAIECGPDEIPGVFDYVLDEPDLDRVTVLDWKSGVGDLPKPREAAQLRAGGVMASRFFKRSNARVAFVRLPEDGEPKWIGPVDLDAFDLGLHAGRMAGLADERDRQIARIANGQDPEAVTGPHCRYCPSFVYCAPSTALVRVLADEPINLEADVTEALAKSDEAARVAVEKYEIAKAVLNRIGKAIKMHAANRPIPMGEGREYGPIDVERTILDGEKVFDTLARVTGDPKLAALAVKKKATKKGIAAVAKVVAEKRTASDKAANPKAKKTTIKSVDEEFHGLIESDGGKTSKASRRFKVHAVGVAKVADDGTEGESDEE
jgi:hypothetical protein